MKKLLINYLSFILILGLGIFLISCTNDDELEQETAKPVIDSISPMYGTWGETINIFGSNFNTDTLKNLVKFNNLIARVSFASHNILKVVVPKNATTGKVSVAIDSQLVIFPTDFTVKKPLPIIKSFLPDSATIGTSVTIIGKNFSTNISDNTVTFNDVPGIVTTAHDTMLVVKIPEEASTGKIKVTVSDQSVISANKFVIKSVIIYSFSPIRGLAGNTVTLSGTSFSSQANLNVVKFNNVLATVQSATTSQLVVTVPAAATTGKITVKLGNQTATSLNDFEILKDIPRDGLVAFYPFTGNANDGGSNSLNGTVSGAALANDRYSKANHAYSFDGVNDYINCGNSAAFQISGKITMAAWINLAELPAQSINILSKYKYYNDGNKGYYFYAEKVSTYGRNGLLVNEPGTGTNWLSGNFAANQWIFLAVTLDGTNINYYSNGTHDLNGTTSPQLTNCAIADVVIGANSDHTAWFFKGLIDDLAIYNRALSAAEIKQLYDQNITKY